MTERVLILGTSQLARNLASKIQSGAYRRISLIGAIREGQDSDEAAPDFTVLGSLEDLSQLVSDHKPDRIIVALSERRGHLLADRLVESQVQGQIVVETGVEAYERLTGKLAIESLTPSNVLFTSQFSPSRRAIALARTFSLAIACIGLLLGILPMALIALAVRLDSPGPVLFVQERAGLGRRRFKLLKFRTMHDTDSAHSEWARDNSHRITRIGKYLRKFRLDEMPQFINVLRGDMNIVGPRPHPVSNRDLFTLVSRNTPLCGEQIPYYSLRSSVRPGITGWAQVRYKYANGLDEEMEKLRYDLYYIKHYSFLLDLRILLETVKVVVLGHESSADSPETDAAEMSIGEDPSRPEIVELDANEDPDHLLPGLALALRTRDGRRSRAGNSLNRR